MTEKRFELIELYGDDHLIDNETNEKIGYDLHSPSTFNANWNNVCNLLNALHEENQQLKAQLYCDNNEGICNICQHQYLVGDNTGYYIAKCKKGHEECSKETVRYCEDFRIVEIDIND